jgi:preprotein translocase subunit SecA
MFGKLFGGKPEAVHVEDQVWATAAARRNGLQAECERRLSETRSVMLVCLTNGAFDIWAETLAAHNPAHCRDLFGRKSLDTQLSRPGTLVLALASSLPTDAAPTRVPVDVLVYERHAARLNDDAIVRYADRLGKLASITFHLSLEDDLLAPFVGSVKPLLVQLGMKEDEAMSHVMITRSIANCQKK